MRHANCNAYKIALSFQSTHPLRGATQFLPSFFAPPPISIHAPLAGCDLAQYNSIRRPYISIHAPLAGCDCGGMIWRSIPQNFNPRTPCGVRLFTPHQLLPWPPFQSTHPLRGATSDVQPWYTLSVISIHAPLAGCDHGIIGDCAAHDISIHAPLAGCDPVEYYAMPRYLTFQSTHPLRGATNKRQRMAQRI